MTQHLFVGKIMLALGVFSLPLGTVLLFSRGYINGVPWSLGNIGIYLFDVFFLGYFFFRLPEFRMIFFRHLALFLSALFFLALPVLFSLDPLRSLFILARLVLALGVFLLIRKEEAPFLPWVWFAGLLVPLAVALLQLFGYAFSSSALGVTSHPAAQLGTSVVQAGGHRLLRLYGTFPHPNVFGGYLSLTTLLAFLLSGTVFYRRRLALLSFIVFVAGFFLALTFSRSAILGLLLGVLVLLLVHRFASVPRRVLFGAGAGFLLGALLFLPAFITRMQGGGRLEVQSIDRRVQSLSDGLQLFSLRPLTGVGPGVSPLGIEYFLRPGVTAYEVEPPHHILLLVLAEFGILGSLGLLLLAWMVWRSGKSIFFSVPILTCWLTVAFFDHYPMSSPQAILSFAVVLGMVFSPSLDICLNPATEKSSLP